MRLLLDTHVLLWALTDDSRLSASARELIQEEQNQIHFSAASIWEIDIKHSLAPKKMPIAARELRAYCFEAGYTEIAIHSTHAAAVGELPPLHKDPFDRILVAQALTEPLCLLTHDPLVSKYSDAIRRV